MRAIAVERFGQEPELMELPTPDPAAGEVLIRLEAASVNPMDWKIGDGALKDQMEHTFPLILGVDGAGLVEAVGRGVQRFAPGDRVFGQLWSTPTGKGTFADYVAIPEEITNGAIAPIPDGISMTDAAALPTAGMTALGAVEALGAEPGQTVLIIGATGGVGSFAVQVAAARGAHVIATARADAEQWARALGASETIDYADRPVADALTANHPQGIDAIVDLVGDQQLLAATARHVRDGGHAISIAFGITPELADGSRITARNYGLQRKQDLLGRVGGELAAQRIRAEIEASVPLAQAPVALAKNRAGGVRGKTVIRI